MLRHACTSGSGRMGLKCYVLRFSLLDILVVSVTRVLLPLPRFSLVHQLLCQACQHFIKVFVRKGFCT